MRRKDNPLNEPRQDAVPDLEAIAQRVETLRSVERPRFARLWAYFANPMRPLGVVPGDTVGMRPYRQAQEWGLPARITGCPPGCGLGDETSGQSLSSESARKEVVIENDIGWRVETMVDYLFGRPVVLNSAAPEPDRRRIIGQLLRGIIAGNGGLLLFQQMALLGSVHGFVDVLVKLNPHDDGASPTPCGTRDLGEPVRCDETSSANVSNHDNDDRRDDGGVDRAASSTGAAPITESGEESATETRSGLDEHSSMPAGASGSDSHDAARGPATAGLDRLARMVRLEVVEPARALPFLSSSDYRNVVAYGQCYEVDRAGRGIREAASERRISWVDRLRRLTSRNPLARCAGSNDQTVVVELITPARWIRYEDGKVVSSGDNSLGRIPLVHVQNTALPFQYAGGSDVEPLIPLQDELNTRLSDRAHRITLQSFKMYLGKGIENFTSMPVSPGRMWMSDNDQAEVIEFGGDASCPSEESHISDVREALDKTSGVTPIAAGAVEGRIGHLTSAVALRITLQALLARTEKKRTTYGTAIERMCELALEWLDRAGLFATTADERRIELTWPSPIPENEMERLQEAEAKARLGVSREIILRELGY